MYIANNFGFLTIRRMFITLAKNRIVNVLQHNNITSLAFRNIVRPVLKLQLFVTIILSWLYLSCYQANIESWWLEKTLKQNSVFTQAELRTQFLPGTQLQICVSMKICTTVALDDTVTYKFTIKWPLLSNKI